MIGSLRAGRERPAQGRGNVGMCSAARWLAWGPVLGLGLLAGCSRAEHKPAQPAGAAPPPHAAGLGAFVRPRPKAGLWKTSLATDAGPGVRMSGELCLDEATEDQAFNASRSGKAHCGKTSFAPDPSGGVSFKTTCTVKGRTIVSQGVATGDFSSSYAIDATTRMDPPIPGAPAEVHTRIQATYAGPCRPGQKPGQASLKFSGFG